MSYHKILAALDFSDSGLQAVNQARELAEKYQASLSIAHVVEYLPPIDTGLGLGSPYEFDLTEQMIALSRKRLHELAHSWGIPEERCHIEVGSPKAEIVRLSEEIEADLIVVGSHGRHGLGLLLGSTATGVLHHARCDVLAVRLPE